MPNFWASVWPLFPGESTEEEAGRPSQRALWRCFWLDFRLFPYEWIVTVPKWWFSEGNLFSEGNPISKLLYFKLLHWKVPYSRTDPNERGLYGRSMCYVLTKWRNILTVLPNNAPFSCRVFEVSHSGGYNLLVVQQWLPLKTESNKPAFFSQLSPGFWWLNPCLRIWLVNFYIFFLGKSHFLSVGCLIIWVCLNIGEQAPDPVV